jgi:hypothetical protein
MECVASDRGREPYKRLTDKLARRRQGMRFDKQRGFIKPRAAIVALVCFLPWACNRSSTDAPVYPVGGEVFFKGEPASGAVIHFHPVDEKNGSPAFGTVKEDGSFELSTFDTNDGAEEGDYIVTINWRTEERIDGETISGPDLLGGRYSHRNGSTLRATVTAGENALKRFDLKEHQDTAD